MALRIARYWNREPDWFYSLTPHIQHQVLAEYRLTHLTPQEIKDRQEATKRAKIQAILDGMKD